MFEGCLKAVLRVYVYASCIVRLLKLFWLKNCRKTMCCSQWTMKNICTFEKSKRLFIYSHRQSVFCPRERYLFHSICCHRYKYVANRMYMIFFTQYSLFIKRYTWDPIDCIKSRRYYILAMVTNSIQTNCWQRCVQTPCNWNVAIEFRFCLYFKWNKFHQKIYTSLK